MNYNEYLEEPSGILYKLKLLFGFLCSIFLSFLIIYAAVEDVSNLKGLYHGHIYIKASRHIVSLMLLSPIILCVPYGAFQLFFERLIPEKISKIFSKMLVVLTISSIVVMAPYAIWLDSFIKSKGYSRCRAYSESRKYSRVVYVKDPAYCAEYAGDVKSDILDWIDAQVAQGKEPTAGQLHSVAQQLTLEYLKRKSER